MDYGFDKVIDRYGTNCAKFDLVQAYGLPENVLPMWVADMDFQAPPCVRDALKKAVEFGIFGYSFAGCEYFQAIEKWFLEGFDWQIQRDWVVTTPGVVFALSAAIRALTEKGDAVLIQTPVYYPFYQVIGDNGRTLVENPLLYQDGTYRMDFADLEQKIKDNQVKLMILCSPHNPVGRVWTEEELVQVGRLCQKYGVLVIADEIHCDFAFPAHPHTPFLKACPWMAEQAMSCTAPSKTFNLAGLQVSNIIVPGQQLRERFRQEMKLVCYDEPNCLGMIAATAAYQEGRDWLNACKAYMQENLSYLRTFLQNRLPEIRLVEPEGTYLVWLDCSALGLEGKALDDLFGKKAGIWLDGGAMFGKDAGQFQRVVLACPKATVVEAMDRLEKALRG